MLLLALSACERRAPVVPAPGDGPEIVVGPIVGGVEATTATVRARLAAGGEARLLLAEAGEDPVEVAVAEAVEADGFAVAFSLDGLSPDTAYNYVVTTGAAPAVDTLRAFRTAPEGPADFGVALFADSKRNPAPAYGAALALGPAFAVQLGDLDHSNPGDGDVTDVGAFREAYRRILADSDHADDLAPLLASTPLVHTWDDHDYGDNDADRLAVFRAASTRAFREAFPQPELPNPDGGNWHALRWGQLELFVLDTRSQRDPNAWGDGSMLDGEALGDSQLDWLLDGLATSDATWKGVISSSCWSPGCDVGADSWAAHASERAAIVEALAGLDGVFVVSGDIHTGGALDDGTNAYVPELSVPTTNADAGSCTTPTGACGTWSEGVVDPALTEADGFGWLAFTADPPTVTLQAWGADGALRLEKALTPPEAAVR